ncbi:MAG: sigma-70 family RNA polymerase sigma factor [Lentisphaeria bacterium]|nr:sigma-70 family RNA polymerase sigma factor [Lentisphaeria bacterium]NQZ69342.1 sigma-70 family RNA polymerase sigma factor [Lentisphaeria bacterium]
MSDDNKIEEENNVLRLLKAGDDAAAARLIEVFGDRVYGLCTRILGSEEDAQEVAQETFLQVWRKWPTFKEQSKFSSWIYRIAANFAYMKLRKKKRLRNEISYDQVNNDSDKYNENLLNIIASDQLSPAEILANKELQELFDDCVKLLPDIYRTAYVLKDIEGLSVKEISDVMTISDSAVKSRVHRARLEMRNMLSDTIQKHGIKEQRK